MLSAIYVAHSLSFAVLIVNISDNDHFQHEFIFHKLMWLLLSTHPSVVSMEFYLRIFSIPDHFSVFFQRNFFFSLTVYIRGARVSVFAPCSVCVCVCVAWASTADVFQKLFKLYWEYWNTFGHIVALWLGRSIFIQNTYIHSMVCLIGRYAASAHRVHSHAPSHFIVQYSTNIWCFLCVCVWVSV